MYKSLNEKQHINHTRFPYIAICQKFLHMFLPRASDQKEYIPILLLHLKWPELFQTPYLVGIKLWKSRLTKLDETFRVPRLIRVFQCFDETVTYYDV